jgi:hypothetical protein
MDEHYLAMMALHEGLARMSDKPRQFRGTDPSVRMMQQAERAWREERFGYVGGFDAMKVPF